MFKKVIILILLLLITYFWAIAQNNCLSGYSVSENYDTNKTDTLLFSFYPSRLKKMEENEEGKVYYFYLDSNNRRSDYDYIIAASKKIFFGDRDSFKINYHYSNGLNSKIEQWQRYCLKDKNLSDLKSIDEIKQDWRMISTTILEYDTNKNVIRANKFSEDSMFNGIEKYKYTYDSLGRKTVEYSYANDDLTGRTYYEYSKGYKKESIFPSNLSRKVAYVIHEYFTRNNELYKLVQSGKGYPNGKIVTTIQYNINGLPLLEQTYSEKMNKILVRKVYHYKCN